MVMGGRATQHAELSFYSESSLFSCPLKWWVFRNAHWAFKEGRHKHRAQAASKRPSEHKKALKSSMGVAGMIGMLQGTTRIIRKHQVPTRNTWKHQETKRTNEHLKHQEPNNIWSKLVSFRLDSQMGTGTDRNPPPQDLYQSGQFWIGFTWRIATETLPHRICTRMISFRLGLHIGKRSKPFPTGSDQNGQF